MGQFFQWFVFWVLALVGFASAAEMPRLTAGFLKTEIHPGEMVEFEAKIQAESVARFKLKLPETAVLMLIANEAGPIRFEGGHFFQVQRWVFQAVASGLIRWESLEAQVIQAGGENAYPLPAATLRVLAYAESDESTRPQGLPSPPSAPQKTHFMGIGSGWIQVGFLGLIVCSGIGLVWKYRRGRR